MGREIKTLSVSGSVAQGATNVDSYVPPNGATVSVKEFFASAAFHESTMVCLVWDHGGQNPLTLGCIKGEGEVPAKAIIQPPEPGDGVKKIAVIAANNHNPSGQELFGSCKLTVDT